MIELNTIYNEDCLEGMKRIPDKFVDMILCDLPYGQTECKWDCKVNLTELWNHYNRIIKDKGAIILTASQPFTTTLINSNTKEFKYEWIWIKSKPTGFLNAKNAPMKKHENVLVFSKGMTANGSANNMNYYPQGLIECSINKKSKNNSKDIYSTRPSRNNDGYIQKYTGYPCSILEFASEGKNIHPTQKPVPLFEYLIRTYTNEGELVLDNCMGSGTTAVAAINTKRNYIGFELDKGYFDIANKRIEEHKNKINE